jgi:hypothetical protein
MLILADFRVVLGWFRVGKCRFTNDVHLPSKEHLLHFVAFFHVASLFSTGVDNEKVEVDNEKALELDNRFFFHISA